MPGKVFKWREREDGITRAVLNGPAESGTCSDRRVCVHMVGAVSLVLRRKDAAHSG